MPLFFANTVSLLTAPNKKQRRLDESEMHSPLVYLFHLTTLSHTVYCMYNKL